MYKLKAKDEHKMFSMKLHELLILSERFNILRVPGGWIYILVDDHENTVTMTFVPFICSNMTRGI